MQTLLTFEVTVLKPANRDQNQTQKLIAATLEQYENFEVERVKLVRKEIIY